MQSIVFPQRIIHQFIVESEKNDLDFYQKSSAFLASVIFKDFKNIY